MRVLIVLLPLVASCFAREASYNPAAATQKGLLVLPKPAPQGSTSYSQGQYVTKSNYNQQAPEILSPEFAEKRGVYFVEVPQERIQALQGYYQQQVAQASAQYNQEESNPVNVRYLPLEDIPAQIQSLPSQYRQDQASEVPVVRYLPVPLSEDYRKTEDASEQQAVVQYSEVQPIRGPIYSYSPQAITRILRYAPQY